MDPTPNLWFAKIDAGARCHADRRWLLIRGRKRVMVRLLAGSPAWSPSDGPGIVVNSAKLTRGSPVERNLAKWLSLLLARHLLPISRLLKKVHQALRQQL